MISEHRPVNLYAWYAHMELEIVDDDDNMAEPGDAVVQPLRPHVYGPFSTQEEGRAWATAQGWNPNRTVLKLGVTWMEGGHVVVHRIT